MELKDVKIEVKNPNDEYCVGISKYETENGWENFYTDGRVRVLRDEGVYSDQSYMVRVEGATYVARQIGYDPNETDVNKMKYQNYRIIGSDPAATIEQIGLDNIFSSAGSSSVSLTTANIYSKKKEIGLDKPNMLPGMWK